MYTVVPLVGTWIEIRHREHCKSDDVVPLVGTWIEMILTSILTRRIVVPLVGTWIEMVDVGSISVTWGRAPRGHVD